jgi:hypothetical protein
MSASASSSRAPSAAISSARVPSSGRKVPRIGVRAPLSITSSGRVVASETTSLQRSATSPA